MTLGSLPAPSCKPPSSLPQPVVDPPRRGTVLTRPADGAVHRLPDVHRRRVDVEPAGPHQGHARLGRRRGQPRRDHPATRAAEAAAQSAAEVSMGLPNPRRMHNRRAVPRQGHRGRRRARHPSLPPRATLLSDARVPVLQPRGHRAAEGRAAHRAGRASAPDQPAAPLPHPPTARCRDLPPRRRVARARSRPARRVGGPHARDAPRPPDGARRKRRRAAEGGRPL
eukprot:6161415-Prymnesium_polylepis.1